MTHDPRWVEAVARAIAGPCFLVPHDCWSTLEQLRDEYWSRLLEQNRIRRLTEAKAALDTLASMGALVPTGWQAVPVEATDVMRRATYATDSWHAGYAAILAAAPKPGGV